MGGGGGGGVELSPSRKGSTPLGGRASPTLSPPPGGPRNPTTTIATAATTTNGSTGVIGGNVGTGTGGGTGLSPGKKQQLAGTLLGRGVVPCSLIGSKPRHEQFFECGTRLTLSATFHRLLQHPQDPPSALPLGTLTHTSLYKSSFQ